MTLFSHHNHRHEHRNHRRYYAHFCEQQKKNESIYTTHDAQATTEGTT
jgi:hypothetical protein